jgi:CDP-glycerol glycerophosphotransferase (TagB/SpsB family)
MTAAFSPLSRDQTWLTGLPRNNLILKSEEDLPVDYLNHLDELCTRLAGRRFILYAPTWRENKSGIYPFTDAETERLSAALSAHNCALGIRAHANWNGVALDKIDSGIFSVTDFPDVNVLLRKADVLITDYSSIFIDFLITGKPILHFAYDIESYENERGFLYNLNEAMGSERFSSFNELIRRLEATFAGQTADAERYAKAKALFHSHRNRCAEDVTEKLRMLSRPSLAFVQQT